MSEILSMTESAVQIGDDNGAIVDVPLASLQFTHPQVGDTVRIYKDDKTLIVKRIESVATAAAGNADRREVNKILYVLLCFFLGVLGVHRFMRGQVGLGILMLLVSWATFGIWPLIEFIISLTKLSAYPGDNFVFTADGRFTK